jgi:hypothetical protein
MTIVFVFYSIKVLNCAKRKVYIVFSESEKFQFENSLSYFVNAKYFVITKRSYVWSNHYVKRNNTRNFQNLWNKWKQKLEISDINTDGMEFSLK